jgi:hypothetical protein
LVEGEYRPFELTTEPDGVLKGFSPTLGLSLCWDEARLYLYDPVTGEYLRNYPEIKADLEAAKGRVRSLRKSCAVGKPEISLPTPASLASPPGGTLRPGCPRHGAPA